MSHLLLYYQRPEPATWVFLSSFLLLSLYFVFHRFFSVRNLDICLLILLAPGLMMVYEGRLKTTDSAAVPAAETLATQSDSATRSPRPTLFSASAVSSGTVSSGTVSSGAVSSGAVSSGTVSSDSAISDRGFLTQAAESSPDDAAAANPLDAYPADPEQRSWTPSGLEFYGFAALLLACLLLLIRMLIDPALVRRPLLVPNLSIGGLSFIGISLFLFLMANVITSSPAEQVRRSPKLGPGYALLNMLPTLPVTPDGEVQEWPEAEPAPAPWLQTVARIVAILSNLAIVVGIVGVGYWHFDNVKTGIGCAVMYLLLPYTAQMTGNLDHAMPAALMVLALLAYRQPLIAGVLFGLAAGLVYYPLFLLPLWMSFYWNRGRLRLAIGFVASLCVLAGLLLLEGVEAFWAHLSQMFGLWLPRMEGLEGIWGPDRIPADFRLPVLVACVLLSFSFVLWPIRKNFGTLICGTAAIMLAVQFWHGFGGGLYMAWFLPFVLLTIFRPNLDDRIATNVVRNTSKT